VQGLLNSYRDPKTHKIHRTLPFPPHTTLIGLAGAASGLSEDILWKKYKELQVAVIDITKETSSHGVGRTDDLIRYKKYKDNTIETSIYVRELLYKPEYMIYYASSNKNILTELYDAFLNPKYALSLGRDDELITLQRIEKIHLTPVDSGEYSETILPFNPATENFNIDLDNEKYFEPYILATLPSTFTEKKGVRTPTNFKTYAFLKNLKIYIEKSGGFTDGEHNFFFL
jgi:CRISPR-associated Cas5-like protein